MRASDVAAAVILGLATVTAAQEAHPPDDWKKMYEDASTQLRAAQDRKAELAKQNSQLGTQIADLQKQLESDRIDLDVLRRQSDGFVQQILLIRTFYAGWEPQTPPAAANWGQWQALLAYSLPGLGLGDDSASGRSEWPLLFP